MDKTIMKGVAVTVAAYYFPISTVVVGFAYIGYLKAYSEIQEALKQYA